MGYSNDYTPFVGIYRILCKAGGQRHLKRIYFRLPCDRNLINILLPLQPDLFRQKKKTDNGKATGNEGLVVFDECCGVAYGMGGLTAYASFGVNPRTFFDTVAGSSRIRMALP